MSIIYGLFAGIDWLIYRIASVLFDVIKSISEYNIFEGNPIVANIVRNVYIVVGVLMLFRMVFAAIQYIINPDTFDDREKGMVGILKNTIITVFLILIMPSVFTLAMNSQNAIVKSIPNILLKNGSTSSSITMKSTGEMLSFKVLESFVPPKPGTSNQIHDIDSFKDHAADGVGLFSWGGAKYNYMIIICTAAGAFLVYILLSMALDVAIRCVKLGVIQMLSPIPISCYAFNKEKFNKFVKISAQVYADLFIRMAVIYLIVVIVNIFANPSTGSRINVFAAITAGSDFFETFKNILTRVGIVFGLLMFAKSAPKFITDLLGLPEVSGNDMKDMFSPAWQRAGGAAGALVNPASQAAANYRQSRLMGRSFGESLRRGVGGLGRGAADALQGIANGDDWKKMRSRHDAALGKSAGRINTQKNKEANTREGRNRLGRLRDQINELRKKTSGMHDPNVAAEAERRYAAAQQRRDDLANQLKNGNLTGADRDKAINEYAKLTAELGDKQSWINNAKMQIMAEQSQAKIVADANAKINANNAKIAQIDAQLASGTLSDSEYADKLVEKQKLLNENKAKEAEIEGVTHAQEEAAENQKKNNATARKTQIDTEINDLNQQVTDLNNQKAAVIAEYDEDMKYVETLRQVGGDSAANAEQERIIKKRDAALAQIENDSNSINTRIETLNAERANQDTIITNADAKIVGIHNKIDAKLATIVDDYKKDIALSNDLIAQQAEIMREIELSEKAINSAKFGSLNSYFGGTNVSGKGYTELASLLSQNRSSMYINEAMTKMRQNADILVYEDGNPVTFTTKFSETNMGGKGYSYEQMVTIKTKLANREITEEQLQDEYGFKNAALFGSAFEDIEKKAAEAYVNANVAVIDDVVASKTKYRLKRPNEANSAILEWWDTFERDLVKSGVDGSVISSLKNQFRTNPGEFLKMSSSYKDLYNRVGKKIVDAEKPKDDK